LSSIGHLFHNGEIPNAREFTEVREEEVEPISLTVYEDGLTREGIHDGVMSVFHVCIITGLRGRVKKFLGFLLGSKGDEPSR